MHVRSTLANNSLGGSFETVQSMARRYSSEEKKVLGAINGDYFEISDPSNRSRYVRNLMIKDDEFVIGKTYSRSQFAIDIDGNPLVGMFRFFGNLEFRDETYLRLSDVNQARDPGKMVIYNHYWGNSTDADNSGIEMRLKIIDDKRVNEPIRVVVEKIENQVGNMAIPGPDYYVISGAEEEADAMLEKAEIGDTLSLMVGFQPDFSETTIHANNKQHNIDGYNVYRNTNMMILYDRLGGSDTGSNQFGKEVLLQPVNEFSFIGETLWVVIKEEDGEGSMEIPPDHIVLSGHGPNHARGFLRENVSLGDTLMIDFKINEATHIVSQLVGGGPRLITDGVLPTEWSGLENFQDSHNLNRHPRSAVGICKENKRIIFMVIDGRQTGSRGATMRDVAQTILSLGAWNAVNLDGGGSSTLIVDDEWVHRPTDSNWMRPIGNALVAIAEPYEGEELGGIEISPKEKVVEKGDNFNFEITGLDLWGDRVPVTMDDITWEIIDLNAIYGRGGFFAQDISEGYIVAHYQESLSDTAFVSIQEDLSSEEDMGHPQHFRLAQNYPNPFNPDTRIEYDLPVESNARLVVYDIVGRPVATLVNEVQSPGTYSISFDASNLASGTYIYELNTGSRIFRKKMMLIK